MKAKNANYKRYAREKFNKKEIEIAFKNWVAKENTHGASLGDPERLSYNFINSLEELLTKRTFSF